MLQVATTPEWHACMYAAHEMCMQVVSGFLHKLVHARLGYTAV